MFRRIVIAYAAHHYDVLMKKNMVMIEATYVYFDMCYDLLVLKMLSVSLWSVTYQFPGWEHALTPRANNRGWARETARVSERENRPRNGFMPIQARDSLHNNRWKIALLLIFIFIFIRNDNRFSRIHCNPRSYVPLHIVCVCVCVYVCKYLYSDVNNNVVMYFLCWSIDFDV